MYVVACCLNIHETSFWWCVTIIYHRSLCVCCVCVALIRFSLVMECDKVAVGFLLLILLFPYFSYFTFTTNDLRFSLHLIEFG